MVSPLATTTRQPTPGGGHPRVPGPVGRAGPVPAQRILKCEGNIIQAVGNFSAYTSKVNPIMAVLKFFYGAQGAHRPVYMLRPNGKTGGQARRLQEERRGLQHPVRVRQGGDPRVGRPRQPLRPGHRVLLWHRPGHGTALSRRDQRGLF